MDLQGHRESADLEFCGALVDEKLVDLDALAARLAEVPHLDPKVRSAVEARLEAMAG